MLCRYKKVSLGLGNQSQAFLGLFQILLWASLRIASRKPDHKNDMEVHAATRKISFEIQEEIEREKVIFKTDNKNEEEKIYVQSDEDPRKILCLPGIAVVSALALAVIAACAAQSEESGSAGRGLEELTVAFSQSGTLNQWRVTESNDMIEAAEKTGCKLIYTDADDDIAQQNSDLLWIVEQKPDYIVITPRDYYGLEEGLAAAREAGIPVIIIERNVSGIAGTDYATVIKSNLVRQGEMCAEYLSSIFDSES